MNPQVNPTVHHSIQRVILGFVIILIVVIMVALSAVIVRFNRNPEGKDDPRSVLQEAQKHQQLDSLVQISSQSPATEDFEKIRQLRLLNDTQ